MRPGHDRSLSGLEQTQNLASKIGANVATLGVDVSKPGQVSNMVAQSTEAIESATRHHPVGRIGRPEEIANKAVAD